MDSPRVVFMGSPDFAVPSLRSLAGTYRICGVVTQPDRPSGRGRVLVPPPVKEVALELGLSIMQPEKLRAPEAMAQLQEWNPDVIVVAAFGQILRQAVLDLPRHGCINVHGSLLPRWRGAAPIQTAILAGDSKTGITIMKMDAGVDTGPMLAKRVIPILPDDTARKLFDKMAVLGADLLMETLPPYLGGALQPEPQPAEGATYAPMLKKEDGLLDFTHPAEELARCVRAFNPWPSAWMMWQNAPLKIHKAHFAPSRRVELIEAEAEVGKAESGKRVVHQGLPAVGTSHGIIVFDELQPAGKKPMSGKAFLAGARNWAD
jgi:methionyl-tRNA formyltransferase